MTEDKNSPAAEQLKGSIKEALGKLTGDTAVEAEGRRQKREARDDKAAPRRDGPERD